MKNKLVLWGTNAENEKLLIALELQADSSKVMLHTFPEAIADEEFVQKMMHEWRDGKGEVAFPEGSQSVERELSVTESILPDNLKVDRPDLVQRAQTEWHFAVLSDKLHAAYKQELAEFKEKVESLSTYDNKIFTSLRSFWDKVQNQSRERNLYRQHADELRDGINALFEHIKEMRKRVNSEFNEASQKVYDGFSKALEEMEERINEGGAKFNSVFDELKKMQREYHNTRMSNEHRNKLWERLDLAFKKAKERKFGPEVNAGTIADRHDKRLSSLEDAIKRLEDSLYRDDEELAFQRKKVNTSEGQLEAQIRGAKIKMIEERANGKRERLAELTKARNDVHRQATSAHEKEARLAAKEVERQQIEAKKAAIKSEIEAETHAKAAAAVLPAEARQDLTGGEARQGLTGGEATEKEGAAIPEKEDSLFEAASNLLGDVLLDALDTAKAVASVAAEKAGEVLSEVKEKAEEAYTAAAEKASEIREQAEEAYSDAKEKAGDALAEAKVVYSEAKEKAGEVLAEAKVIYSDAKETAGDALTEVSKKAKEVYSDAKEEAGEALTEVSEKAKEVYSEAKEEAGEALTEVSEKAKEVYSDAKEKAGDVFESFNAPAAEDTVGKEETAEVAAAEGIIIDDVVHKSEEDVAGLESEEEESTEDKPKISPEQQADA